MNKVGKVMERVATGKRIVEPNSYKTWDELMNIDWVVRLKEEYKQMFKKEYKFYVTRDFKDGREEYPYALIALDKSGIRVIGWCDENEIIKPMYKEIKELNNVIRSFPELL